MKMFYITDCILKDRIKDICDIPKVKDENLTFQIKLQSSGDTSEIDVFEIEKKIMDQLECIKFE